MYSALENYAATDSQMSHALAPSQHPTFPAFSADGVLLTLFFPLKSLFSMSSSTSIAFGLISLSQPSSRLMVVLLIFTQVTALAERRQRIRRPVRIVRPSAAGRVRVRGGPKGRSVFPNDRHPNAL
eukprot:scaffold48_cov311-Pinguiococcus_pyrenoidosus.AAC.279